MRVMTEQRLGESLVALGHEKEAIASYERSIALLRNQIAKDPNNLRWQKRLQDGLGKLASAYLAFGKAENAFRLYDEAVRLAPKDADAYRNRGRAAFHAGRFNVAIENFAAALKLDPKDAYAALWLHVARVRAGQNDAAELAANTERLDRSQWPWPVIEYYVGHSGVEGLEAAASSAEGANTRKEQTCEANFYAGAVLVNSRRNEAQRLLSTAAQTCPRQFIEYAAAKLELNRLNGGVAHR
jgi:lipoprotein NlpI